MIDLHLKFFKLTIDLHIDCKCDKHKVSSEESDTKVIETPRNKSENLYDENINDNQNAEEILPTPIELQASLFEQELRNSENLYDIPTNSDIPPKYQIQDDVEVITESFERELEDLYEGRR